MALMLNQSKPMSRGRVSTACCPSLGLMSLNKKAARVGGLSCSLSTCQLAHVSPREASPRAQNARRMLTAPETSGDSPRPAAWTVKESVVFASMR